MSETEIKKYLIKKYIEDELFDSLEIKTNKEWFDPYIYPGEGYIPLCSQCNNDFNNFDKNNNFIIVKHSNSCLWNEYFIKKFKSNFPDIKIIKNKK
jgi:hypothetical protein